MEKIVERKIRYDSKIVDYSCRLLTRQKQSAVLFHIIEESFTMIANGTSLTIPIGSYTIAYYWENLPYNLYFWRDQQGNYLGSYFNIAKHTTITDKVVSFEDLIIDIMVFPNGEYFILDENELPESIEHFENGFVKQAMSSVIESLPVILSQAISESKGIYKHERFIPYLEECVNKHT